MAISVRQISRTHLSYEVREPKANAFSRDDRAWCKLMTRMEKVYRDVGVVAFLCSESGRFACTSEKTMLQEEVVVV